MRAIGRLLPVLLLTGYAAASAASGDAPRGRITHATIGHAPLVGSKKAQTLLYTPGAKGVYVYTEAGQLKSIFAKGSGANAIAMDDSGNVYVHFAKGSSTGAALYAIGGKKPKATYTPSTTELVGLLQASHQGELVWWHFVLNSSKSEFVYDIWDPGVTGKPSRTFTYPTGEGAFAVDNNGALYVPYHDTVTQTQRYDEIPAGASHPSRTIVDKLVKANGPDFAAFSMVALTDGTLYVGEWSFTSGDPLAGLYIYPPHGKETFVSNGSPNPSGTSVDAAGNVYVLNSSLGFDPSTGQFVCDTVHTLSTYSSNAKQLLSQATSGFTNGQSLVVEAQGTAFISEFEYSPSEQCPDPQGTGAVASVAPGASAGTQIINNLPSQEVVLYDGTHATNPNSQALP